MRDKRDSQKKRFIDALTANGTICHAARAAGVSRWTAYRWRSEDKEFREAWDYALDDAIEAVESKLYQSALAGNTLASIFWLKAHRPIYREIRMTKRDLMLIQTNVHSAVR
jgi:hypothetical protein